MDEERRRLLDAVEAAAGGPTSPLVVGAGDVLARSVDAGTLVFVEGISDQAALERLALRTGRDLMADGIVVLPIGGAMSLGRFLRLFAGGPSGGGPRLAGVCDAGEAHRWARSLERAGLGRDLDRAGMGRLGFSVCEDDLEDEMIRAVGAERVVDLLEREGELASFRTMQRQPAQRGRSLDAQLRRFAGTRSGRKQRHAVLLADELDLDALPRPLAALLAHL